MRELRLHTRWASDADTPALLALFARCFNATMSADEWAWKYRFAPSAGMVCLDDNSIVAFNGGMPRDCRLGQEAFCAVQMGDVMVDPAYRGILTRRGPFYQVVQAFFSSSVGHDADHPYRYAFGFPNARHARLGNALSLYCQTDVIQQASWLVLSRRRLRYTARPLTADDAQTVEQLWAAMRAALPGYAIGERGWQWLTHRYSKAPGRKYALWLVIERFTRRPLGVCVLRRHASHMELLDMIASPHTMAAVVNVARHISARTGVNRLNAWVTPTVASALIATTPTLTDTDVVIPGSRVNGLEQGMEPAGRWWLMGGDTDFR